MSSVLARLIGLVILLVPVAAPAWAQDAARAAVPPPAQAQIPAAPTPSPPPAAAPAAPGQTAPGATAAAEEPPARVGRVSLAEGSLVFHMRGETEWSAAAVNYPVATGASFRTDAKSRAELRIGPSTLDMEADTELDIVTLNQQVAEFGLPKGRIRLHLRELGEGQSVAIDLPRGGVWMLQPGEYDVAAGDAQQPTRIAVLAGSAHFVGDGADVGVKAGGVAVLTGANPVVAKLEKAAPDAFLEWCRSRDYAEKRLAAPYRVSPQMTGYEALDRYGSWSETAGYGEVWYPEVAADWMPYTDGRWAWIEPWGWTWIDLEPWGFAPFHYGRWAFIDGRWGWAPGAFSPHPVYAPALVAFVGGRGFGVGWFPLAPGEPFWPRYTRNLAYVRAVNLPSVRNIDVAVRIGPAALSRSVFVNRRFAVAVPSRVFASAAPVARAAVRLTPALAEHATVTAAPAHVRAPAAAFARTMTGRPAARAANTAPLPPPLHAATPGAVHAPALAAVHREERVRHGHAFRGPAHAPMHAMRLQAHASAPPAHFRTPAYQGPVAALPGPGRGLPRGAMLPPPGRGYGPVEMRGPPMNAMRGFPGGPPPHFGGPPRGMPGPPGFGGAAPVRPMPGPPGFGGGGHAVAAAPPHGGPAPAGGGDGKHHP